MNVIIMFMWSVHKRRSVKLLGFSTSHQKVIWPYRQVLFLGKDVHVLKMKNLSHWMPFWGLTANEFSRQRSGLVTVGSLHSLVTLPGQLYLYHSYIKLSFSVSFTHIFIFIVTFFIFICIFRSLRFSFTSPWLSWWGSPGSIDTLYLLHCTDTAG